MKRFIEGEDRTQVTLLPACLEDYVAAEKIRFAWSRSLSKGLIWASLGSKGLTRR